MNRKLALLMVFVLLMVSVSTALAHEVPSFDAGALFGLDAAPDGSLLVADAFSGIVELRKGESSLVAEVPGVSDVASIGRGAMFAVTGEFGPPDVAARLWRVSRDEGPVEIADLLAFEIANNPAGGPVESNPFDVAVLNGGKALVADAAGNDLLIVDNEGNVDWVATLPNELTSTENLKNLIGCPTPPDFVPPDLLFVCDLPEMIPTEPVATSVAIGPDGAYYVGELKGFPAPVGVSKVWRIEPGTLHAECGTSPACEVVYDGFTSIMDLAFGPDGTLYVVELDENSWFAAEGYAFNGVPIHAGGTINACAADGSGCSTTWSFDLPTAVAVDKTGAVYATVDALLPGQARVEHLP